MRLVKTPHVFHNVYMDKRHREQMRHFHDDRCELVSHLHRLVDENQRLRQWPGAQSNPGFEF